MKVLITGSSGILGGILSNYLIVNKIHVVGIDHRVVSKNIEGPIFKYYNCSITDKKNLESVFRVEQPTHVVHLACTFNKVRDKKREYDIDVGGSKNVLDISNNTPSVKQLIYSSSAAIYGGHSNNPLWLKETYPLKPGRYRYAVNKKLIEQYFSDTRLREDLHLIILRICNVVGPSFNKPRSAVSMLIKLPYLPQFCSENKIQFLHEEDMNVLIKMILQDDQVKGIFNLATDSFSDVKELIPEKKYIGIPVFFIKCVLWFLWNLKMSNLQPASLNISIYPIILDPSKLISRYGYRFKYSSTEAFGNLGISA